MGLFDFFKKKQKLTPESAQFARLIKSLCTNSGIPVEKQLEVTKAISEDFIDNKKRELSQFVYMDNVTKKAYLKKHGLNDLDSDIFINIINTNSDSFLSI